MRSAFVVTGVLGLGTAVVFAVAALTATMFPNGTVLNTGMNGVMMDQRFFGGAVAVPAPAPAIDLAPGISVEAPPEGVKSLPGDIVVSEPAP